MSTPDTRTSDVEETVFKIVAHILGTENWDTDTSFLYDILTSFREKAVAEDRERTKKTAFNIRHCAKVIVASLGDPTRTQIELEHLKAHIEALTPPKETHK